MSSGNLIWLYPLQVLFADVVHRVVGLFLRGGGRGCARADANDVADAQVGVDGDHVARVERLPVGGEVLEQNEALADQPELVNTDPYGEGWIIKIKPSNLSEMDELLDAEAYKALNQLHNQKEFNDGWITKVRN